MSTFPGNSPIIKHFHRKKEVITITKEPITYEEFYVLIETFQPEEIYNQELQSNLPFMKITKYLPEDDMVHALCDACVMRAFHAHAYFAPAPSLRAAKSAAVALAAEHWLRPPYVDLLYLLSLLSFFCSRRGHIATHRPVRGGA